MAAGTAGFFRRMPCHGVLNITPDSFSDGGRFLDADAAVEQGLQMAAEGAAILDVGPESSRPGSQRVPADEQIRRAIPVIERLTAKVLIPISIDTYLPEVASAALDSGAAMINDITGMSNPDMRELAAKRGATVVLMHMLGTPETMQTDRTTRMLRRRCCGFCSIGPNWPSRRGFLGNGSSSIPESDLAKRPNTTCSCCGISANLSRRTIAYWWNQPQAISGPDHGA